LGCTNSTFKTSGIFFIASNLKFGSEITKNKCSRMEQTIAQISVLSLMLEFLIEMSKMYNFNAKPLIIQQLRWVLIGSFS
jgi:hypothetical protein